MQYDFIIIGGGIFGSYAALYLAKEGKKICLIEKEKQLFQKASIVNQARLHGGYHYPRSIATAMMSDENKERFIQEHKDFINFSFEKYYAIDKTASFTNAAQFERFCQYLNIRCDKIKKHSLFNFDKIEALYLTEEFSFDPILIGKYYTQQIENAQNIELKFFSKVLNTQKERDFWQIEIQDLNTQKTQIIQSPAVINATYSNTNAINQLFELDEIGLMHEISEMAFIESSQLKNIGLTVMDGQFGSIMPYGLSGWLSLSSVAYTHHAVSYNNLPTFDCQKINTNCTPNFSSICNECVAKPPSNYRKMVGQMRQYFQNEVEMTYLKSFFTIKSKLQSSHIDDGRPTEIAVLSKKPDFYSLFAGKINSIYEIEKVIELK